VDAKNITLNGGTLLGTNTTTLVANRGLPYELPLGIELYEERYAIPVQTASLPQRRQDAVSGHDLRSHSDAVSLMEDIEQSAEKRTAAEQKAAEESAKNEPPAPELKEQTQGKRKK